MINISVLNPVELTSYWLCFSRWIAIVMTVPLLSENVIPNSVKILFCLVITYAFFSNVESIVAKDIILFGLDNFWFLTFYYLISGLMIGYLVKMIISIFVSSGNLMTQQMGFSSISYFDPSFSSPIGPLGNLIRWALLVMIISSGGLRPIFEGVLSSFDNFALSNFSIGSQTFVYLQKFFKDLVRIALLLSTPILIMNIILNSILGILTRFVPQMNVFMISFVVNIALGLLLFYFIIEEYFYHAYQIYISKLGEWFQFITL